MDHTTQNSVVCSFFKFYIQLKSYHFMTRVYHKHENVDKFLEKYSHLYDKIVEVCMGHHGIINLGDFTLEISNISDENVSIHINNFKEIVIPNMRIIYNTNLDILNLIDEMEAELNKLQYQLSLN